MDAVSHAGQIYISCPSPRYWLMRAKLRALLKPLDTIALCCSSGLELGPHDAQGRQSLGQMYA